MFIVAVVVACGTVRPAAVAAQAFDDDEFHRGLIGTYTNDLGESCQRVDPAIRFLWKGDSPDRRISTGPFSTRWTGYLMSQSTGEYRFHVFARGKFSVKLNGQQLVQGDFAEPAWADSSPIELPFDWHPLEVEFESDNRRDTPLELYWSGPQFQREPIPPRHFFRDPQPAPDGEFDRGRALVRALRCAACHEIAGELPSIAAPSLKKAAANLSSTWVVDWLQQHTRTGGEADGELTRSMPFFDFTETEVSQLAKYLLRNGQDAADHSANGKAPNGPAANGPAANGPAANDPANPDDAATSSKRGKRLFLTLGCLACHRWEDLGQTSLLDGGDLSKIADKRPANFFARWLRNPEELNRDHRMPVFDLTETERDDLATFLQDQSSGSRTPSDFDTAELSAEEIEIGQRLFTGNLCHRCHRSDTPGENDVQRIRLTADSSWRDACTGSPNRTARRPGFALSQADADAITRFVTAVSAVRRPPTATIDGRRLIAEQNCLACHARDDSPGIADVLQKVVGDQPELAAELPAMKPPALNSIGDKLHDAALVSSIKRNKQVHRPWLLVRMPRFPMTDQEAAAVAEHFIQSDRIPEHQAAGGRGTSASTSPRTSSGPSSAAIELAGARLVTPDGFGCTSCHQVGKVKPPKAPLNAKGPDLALLGERIRKPWFDRWVRDPARIVPRMEMPSIKIPVMGVLNDDLDLQIESVWKILNQPGFEPPEPNPVRLVRRSGIRQRDERAVVLTDVLNVEDQVYVKPLLIGLPNRHNLLFDLASGRLSRWWIGDVARQRTKGKTWYWQADAKEMLEQTELAEISLQRGDVVHRVVAVGQFVTAADRWEHTRGGLSCWHRLHLAADAAGKTDATVVLQIKQTFTPIWSDDHRDGHRDGHTGFHRRIEISGGKAGDRLLVRAAVPVEDALARIGWQGPQGTTGRDESGCYVYDVPWPADGKPCEIRLQYSTALPVDRFPVIPPAFPNPEPAELDAVPGFRATRLPLVADVMPTGLAWRPDGTLVFSSLKGRVWLANDTDGDGLEDSLRPIGDEFAAPYGVATTGNAIDVIHKSALSRLIDEDGDGFAERTETLADGWGHTADYHDWVVGLPKDEAGRYYIALPCQQDKRSAAAARHRGTVLKLAPRKPTPDNPHHFTLEEISHGHRFPMGVARNRDGQLFVTDNQGNYNPFNELNHVVAGAHYGFINAIDRKPGIRPPLTPPAINIPHPWTRSVNGICFLETPSSILQNGGANRFGPFEGHLIGCEYDTRRLIRMSLQQVGETIQGAAYPFSVYHAQSGKNLLGPLVCAVSPGGELYVGCIRDSGWGGANNIGSLVQLSFQADSLPVGIAEVRARADGFEIQFTRPVDRELAADRENYAVVSYTRESTPAYGGSDQHRRVEKLGDISVADDGLLAVIRLGELRKDFVYEFRLKNLAGTDQRFFPAEAFYTLRAIPSR